MRSNKTSVSRLELGGSSPALEPVRISNNLIAFYPQPLRQPQPYVILLDPASGICKRVDLRSAK